MGKALKGTPLTVEELKALKEGDWVWLVDLKQPIAPFYAQINEQCDEEGWIWFEEKVASNHYSDYGIKWVAYKNKEQAENADYGDVKQAIKEAFDELKAMVPFGIIWGSFVWNAMDKIIKERLGDEENKN